MTGSNSQATFQTEPFQYTVQTSRICKICCIFITYIWSCVEKVPKRALWVLQCIKQSPPVFGRDVWARYKCWHALQTILASRIAIVSSMELSHKTSFSTDDCGCLCLHVVPKPLPIFLHYLIVERAVIKTRGTKWVLSKLPKWILVKWGWPNGARMGLSPYSPNRFK